VPTSLENALRRDEMENKSRHDTGRDGDDSTPPPIGDNAKREHRQSGQESYFESDRSHGGSFRRILWARSFLAEH
jgi:hypothetical protein